MGSCLIDFRLRVRYETGFSQVVISEIDCIFHAFLPFMIKLITFSSPFQQQPLKAAQINLRGPSGSIFIIESEGLSKRKLQDFIATLVEKVLHLLNV